MNSKYFEDKNGLSWIVELKPGTGVGGGPEGKYATPGAPVLKFCLIKEIKEIMAHRRRSYIDDFSDEELNTLLEQSQQSKP